MYVRDVYNPDHEFVSLRDWGPSIASFNPLALRWWPMDAKRLSRGVMVEFKLKNADYVKPMVTCDNMKLLLEQLRHRIQEIQNERKQ